MEIIKSKIANSLFEFRALQKDNLYTIDKLNWWLMKHEELYQYCKENWKKNSCFDDLPCFCAMESEEHDFYFFYADVSVIADEQKLEKDRKDELLKYELIEDDKAKLKEWVKNNEAVGVEKLGTFLLDHLDYIGDGAEYHLSVFHLVFKDIDIFVDRKDFIHIIEFVKLYNELYYMQELYPEGLEKITKEFETLAIDLD